MSDIKKSIVYTAIPVTILATAGLVVKKIVKKDGAVNEQVKEATTDAIKEIDNTITELKGNLEGKSASQIEKSLDNAVENAKIKLDKIVSLVKSKLHEFEQKGQSEQLQTKEKIVVKD